jgi:hypothetical protein
MTLTTSWLDAHHRAVLDLAVALDTQREFEDRLYSRPNGGYLNDAERAEHAALVENTNQADAALRALREGRAAA